MSWQLLDLKMAPRVMWGSLSLLRLLWCLLPQTGYVHPDEFFQSPEVMAEDILGIEGARPWEFHPSSSCRTVVFPLLTSGFAFWLLKLWKELGPWPGLYNLDPQNLERHGTHLRLTHLALNGFLLFGMLHAQALRAGWQQLRVCLRALAQMRSLRVWDAQRLLPGPSSHLLFLYFTPLALLSAFSHQEARFLIPLIVPLVLLCSPQTQPVPCKGTLVLFNALGALFFGCLHQGGLVPSLEHLERVVHAPVAPSVPTHYTLLFTHTYMPPRHLLHLPAPGSLVEVMEMGGAEDPVLCQTLNNFTRQPACQAAGGPWLCRLFVVTPGTTRPATESCRLPLKSETLVFPHLTLEDPPAMSSLLSGAWRDHLSLHILELGKKPKTGSPRGRG